MKNLTFVLPAFECLHSLSAEPCFLPLSVLAASVGELGSAEGFGEEAARGEQLKCWSSRKEFLQYSLLLGFMMLKKIEEE